MTLIQRLSSDYASDYRTGKWLSCMHTYWNQLNSEQQVEAKPGFDRMMSRIIRSGLTSSEGSEGNYTENKFKNQLWILVKEPEKGYEFQSLLDNLLWLSASNNYLGLVKTLILEGANPTCELYNGKTIIENTCTEAQIGNHIFSALLEGVVDPATVGRDGKTLLHKLAVHCPDDRQDVITDLVRRGLDPNSKDRLGATPLHDAAQHGKVESIKTLFQLNANLNMQDINHETPLHLAGQRGYPDSMGDQSGSEDNFSWMDLASERKELTFSTLVDLGAQETIENKWGNKPNLRPIFAASGPSFLW